MSPDAPPAAVTLPARAHATVSFEFTIEAPMAYAAPLFGPQGERAWAGDDWDPQFIYPTPPRDVQGAVFTLAHGQHPSVWVNTRFDLVQGRMQYVVFLAGLMVTTIDVALEPDGAGTRARVTYTRTALSPAADEHVGELSRADAIKGPQWHDAIAALLRAQAH